MSLSNLVIGFVALVALAVGAYSLATPASLPQLGAIPGTSLDGNEFSINNAKVYAYTQGMVTASTTCSFVSPNATTTLKSFSVSGPLIATTTTIVELGSGVSRFATTSVFTRMTLAPSQGTVVSTTTNTAPVDGIVAPNTFLNVKIGGVGLSWVPNGTCTLRLEGVR